MPTSFNDDPLETTLASETEIATVLAELSDWRLEATRQSLSARFEAAEQEAIASLANRIAHLAWLQGWAPKELRWAEGSLTVRLGDLTGGPLRRADLIRAVAIHGLSGHRRPLEASTPSAPSLGGVQPAHRARFEVLAAAARQSLRAFPARFTRRPSQRGAEMQVAKRADVATSPTEGDARHYLDWAFRQVRQERSNALDAARAALTIVHQLDIAQVAEKSFIDFQAEAWSHLSMAAAAQGLDRPAKLWSRLAERICGLGSGDPRVELLTQMARACALELRTPRAALRPLSLAELVAAQLGEPWWLGWVLLRKGMILIRISPSQGIAALQAGLLRATTFQFPPLARRARAELRALPSESD